MLESVVKLRLLHILLSAVMDVMHKPDIRFFFLFIYGHRHALQLDAKQNKKKMNSMFDPT